MSLQQKLPNAKLSSSGKGITQLQVFGGIFVVIFTIMLVSNIMLSESIKEDAGAINLAGRQRMLSQRLTKSATTMQSEINAKNFEAAKKAQAEAFLSYNLFNDTLDAFREGGDTKGAANNNVTLSAVTKPETKQHVDDASKIWNATKKDILYITSANVDTLNKEQLDNTVKFLTENNLTLLKLMNSLTVGLDQDSQQKSTNQQLVLWVALGLAFAIFAYIVFYALSGLKKRDKELATFATDLQSNYYKLQSTHKALEATQGELNKSNESLQSALESVQQVSNEAQMRANELQEITLDLNRLKEEGDTIFNAVDHGLCLLDNKANIGTRMSRATYEIFETEHLVNRSFIDLMRPLITERDLKTLESFVKLLFNKRSLNSQLEKYNPLKKIEITLNWDGNKFTNKHLGFEFERIMEGDEIAAVLVTITDVTETIALEQELKRANQAQERKTDLVLEIIQSDSTELNLFLSKTSKSLDEINNTLKENGVNENSSGSNKEIVEDVFRIVHNIKGNASMLGLKTIVELSHDVESKLADLRHKEKIKGDEFLSSLLQLAALREYLDDYEEITHGLLKEITPGSRKTAQAAPDKKLTKSEKLATEISQFVTTVANDLDKKVYPRCNFDMENVTDTNFQEMKDIIIQIAKNAVVHGIESPTTRQSKGKLEEGYFTALCELDQSSNNILGKPIYKFTFRDDGVGLNLDLLKEKAITLGIVSKKEAEKLTGAQVAALIFEPSFSTVDEANEHAGRGVGMDIIKHKIVEILGGKLTMNFTPGNFMQLSCFIPAENLNSDSVNIKTA